MKILLAAVNAKYIHSNPAVYSLKAAAGKLASQVELAEYTINHLTEDIFRSIFRKKPDLLFFSCYIWNRRVILELAENIKKVLPETILWIGGPEVSYDAEQFLRENPVFTGVLCGEGEHSFPKLLQFYLEKKELRELNRIPGLVYRRYPEGAAVCSAELRPDLKDGSEGQIEETAICSTGAALMMSSLDELPFTYQDLSEFSNRIIYYESSRGCPFSCSYCLSSIDKQVRFRSLSLVKRDLTFFLGQKVPQVKFVDRTFNCSHIHCMEIWRFIQIHDNGITNFHFEIAADLLTEEELQLLSQMRPGLVQLEIGVQTVNEQSLAAIHRSAGFERIADRVRRISEGGNVHQHLDLIAGLPYEDYESFQNSFDMVYRLKPQELQLGFLKVLRGSEMHQRAEEYGIVYRSHPPYEVLSTRWIGCSELMRLKEVEEMLEVYYNSLQFRFTMDKLECEFDRPFALFEALADYYKEKCPEGKTYSRMQRFELLLGFIRDRNYPDISCYEELLTMDFYLRENAKTRPSWSEDQNPYKEVISQFYQKEENRNRYLNGYRDLTWKQTMRMTHMEHFSFDPSGSGSRKETWILFDYRHRNPLTQDARTIILSLEEL